MPYKFNFKEYYDSHPEFKARHLEKCREKVLCSRCECEVTRVNLSTHRKTMKCKDKANSIKLSELLDVIGKKTQ